MSRILDKKKLRRVVGFENDLNFFESWDLDDPQFMKYLERITILNFNLNSHLDSEDVLEQLKLLLGCAKNLKYFSLKNDSNGYEYRMNIGSIFDNLGSKVEYLNLSGLNLKTSIKQENFDKLTQLHTILFENCELSSLPILPNHKGKVCVDTYCAIPTESLVYYAKEHNLQAPNRDIEIMIAVLNGEKVAVPLEVYQENMGFFKECIEDICISIEDPSKLDLEGLEELKKNTAVKKIHILGGCYHYNKEDEGVAYTLEEYATVRKEIDRIISNVEIPSEDCRDRELKIFTQVYKILGKMIDYDHYAWECKEEGREDEVEALKYSCRNMKNALCGVERDGELKKLTVCAGYADVLKNTLACFGIKSQMIVTKLPEIELGHGHAYTKVCLDGEYYYSDLTQDSNNIKTDRYPLPYFLKSAADFEKSHSIFGFKPQENDKATKTISIEKQFELFDAEKIVEEEIADMISEGYLSGFVSQYLGAIQAQRDSVQATKLIDVMWRIRELEDYIMKQQRDFRS